MEVKYIKMNGIAVSVIFTGNKYYFLNSFYGIIAIAERDLDYQRQTKFEAGVCHHEHFNVRMGNCHLQGDKLGDDAPMRYVKKHINAEEGKYLKAYCKYDYVPEDLNKVILDITEDKR